MIRPVADRTGTTCRRRMLLGGALLLAWAPARRAGAAALQPVTISYQQSSVLLQVLRTRDMLRPRLEALGFTPVWSQLGQSLAGLGGVAFQSDVAESVPVMMHERLPQFMLYAAEGPSPHAAGIVVRTSSGIDSIRALKGRRVAVGKGGSSLDLLLRSLEHNNMALTDIDVAFLPEAGSAAAFQSGHVEAWSTYDPFLSAAEQNPAARLLVDGAAQGMRYDRYYMVDGSFAHANPHVVAAMFDALVEAAAWINTHPDQAAANLSSLWQNMPLDSVRRIDSHRTYKVRTIDASDVPVLQQIADRFRRAGILPDDPNMGGIGIWKVA